MQSFDPEVVRLVREAAPDVRRGLLRLRFEADTVPLATELGVVCCNPSVDDVLGDPETVAELIGAGHRRDAVDGQRHRAVAGAGRGRRGRPDHRPRRRADRLGRRRA